MAYTSNNDEKEFYGSTFSAGQLDFQENIFDGLSPYGELAPNSTAYGELTSANASLYTDVDIFSLGTLSSGTYSIDVDDHTWDWSNYDYGSVSEFSLLNAYGTKLQTQTSVYSDIEFLVSSSAYYYVEIKGPLFSDAQYTVSYSPVITNHAATFSNPAINGSLKVGETVNANLTYSDLDRISNRVLNGSTYAWFVDGIFLCS